jgi:hypothetical protein
VAELFGLSAGGGRIWIGEYGELAGIVTLEDLLEETVGEMHDETDCESTGLAIGKAGMLCGRQKGSPHCLVGPGLRERFSRTRELDADTLSRAFHATSVAHAGDRVDESGYVMTANSLHGKREGASVSGNKRRARIAPESLGRSEGNLNRLSGVGYGISS